MKALIEQFVSKFKKPSIKLDDFWIQKVKLKRVQNRMDVFESYLTNKSVLHIGCTDFPIFDPKNNLHIQIATKAKLLHGMDVDIKGIEELKKHVDSQYYSDIKETYSNRYDTVLVPETIEHVENIGIFLKEINKVDAQTYIITGPNCFHDFFNNAYEEKSQTFTEAIHPDHNCWFSPYTLKNVIQKYTDLKVKEIFLCNNDLMIVCICEK